MKKVLITAILIVLSAIGGWYIFLRPSEGAVSAYSLAEITRGDLETIISSSGTLSPVTTVDVGTQVSGILDKVYVDYNDEVHKGQVLAVLDTILLRASVLEATAGLEKAEAQLEQADADFKRYEPIFKKGLISESEFLPYSVNVKTQQASLKSAQASYQRAMQNLKYAVITSPINGKVIERSVEAGQTVAASLSTPTLFIIAEDLSRMEILVEVDESDIGQIKEGQAVRFEVQTYSDKVFTGTVTQVRLQPTTVSNVVTYTVVVDAANPDYLLLPGMTATVDFIIDSRKDVLLVPNTALRFQPSQEQVTAAMEKMRSRRVASTDGQTPPAGGMGVPPAAGNRPKDMTMLWYLDGDGSLAMEPVKIGLTDGTNTEIVSSRDIKENTQVISGLAKSSTSSTKSSTSNGTPFSGGPPPGGPGF